MKPILLDFPMPITTPRLLLRAPQPRDGIALNAAVLESYDDIRHTMSWAKERSSLEESEEFVRQSAANWIRNWWRRRELNPRPWVLSLTMSNHQRPSNPICYLENRHLRHV